MSMVWIASATVSGSAAQLVFSSIPQTFTHLQIRGRSRATASTADAVIGYQFNGDGGTNYGHGWHVLGGNGSAAFSGNGGGPGYPTTYSSYAPGSSVTANVCGTSIMDILDYTSTTKNKTLRAIGGFDANGSGNISFSGALWLSTAAITGITVIAANDPYTLAVGSRFDLYGITSSQVTGA